MKNCDNTMQLVVSIRCIPFLFARFLTVEYGQTSRLSFCDVMVLEQKVLMKQEKELQSNISTF